MNSTLFKPEVFWVSGLHVILITEDDEQQLNVSKVSWVSSLQNTSLTHYIHQLK